MKNLSFSNIVSETLDLFPEYKNTHYYNDNDKEIEYSFFYGFTDYVNNLIDKSSDPISDPNIKKIFSFFNSMISSNDEKISTLAIVEIIENLVQFKKSKEIALELLNEDGRKYLANVLKFTGISD